MNDLKDKTLLIYDTGTSCGHAEKLAESFKTVWYYSPFNTASPKVQDFAHGYGIGKVVTTDNIRIGGASFEKPIKFFDYVEKADCIMFPDVGMGDIAEFIKRNFPTKRVFGAGKADILEEHRAFLKHVQKNVLGLPTQKSMEVKGTAALRDVLSKRSNLFVKLNQFRGNRETFKGHNLAKADRIIDEIEYEIGPFKSILPFNVEEEIKGGLLEPGFDLFFNGKDFIKPYQWGIECDSPYIGKFSDKLPPTMQKTIEALQPILSRMDYRGAVSTEEILINKDKSYFLDFTARFPQPLSVIWTESITNFSDVIWKVAGKEDVTINPIAEYVGCLPVHSGHAKDSWLKVYYDKKFSRYIKPHFGCEINGERSSVPVNNNTIVATLIAWGKSPQSVADKLKKLLEEVDADYIEKDHTALDRIMKDIKKLKDLGIDF
jgi:hypothetical protein